MDEYKPIAFNSEIIEKFKSIDVSRMTPPQGSSPHFELPETHEIEPIPLAEHMEKTEEYQAKSLEILQSINANTANLYTLVDLISKSNEKQDEILEIITEILAIAKAKEKKEADSLFKRVMTKINDTVETADSVVKIVGWATTIYNMVVTMLPK